MKPLLSKNHNLILNQQSYSSEIKMNTAIKSSVSNIRLYSQKSTNTTIFYLPNESSNLPFESSLSGAEGLIGRFGDFRGGGFDWFSGEWIKILFWGIFLRD